MLKSGRSNANTTVTARGQTWKSCMSGINGRTRDLFISGTNVEEMLAIVRVVSSVSL